MRLEFQPWFSLNQSGAYKCLFDRFTACKLGNMSLILWKHDVDAVCIQIAHTFGYFNFPPIWIKIFELQVKYLYSWLKWKIHSAHAYTNIIYLGTKRLIII